MKSNSIATKKNYIKPAEQYPTFLASLQFLELLPQKMSKDGENTLARQRAITPLGWEIKRKLAALQMTQKDFCKLYGIPEHQLSFLITGKRVSEQHKKRISEILGISEEIQTEKDKQVLCPLGKAIKIRLIELDMNQKELAAKIGISNQYLHAILYGERNAGKYLEPIASNLNLKIESLKNIS